ncbi:hypothetical protein [Haloquadratum walsbyi]|jgi:hypothetical protein|uniref:CopG family transcriptional regulator n=1 Tax=Haloquadratum walsbyi J07HQW2 TaxID=1238425 RepID=U1NFW9_9EURY|nr:hypothetical protein [Haloquadratum walsbyi]ERG95713.1 MAG: hypothetical protein J07HQW2_02173 [Haloquadratum walsbyi J07HQW2]
MSDSASPSVTVPTDLYDQLQTRVGQTEFDSADAYVQHVLRVTFEHLERDQINTEQPTVTDQQVEDRLRSLGYLND